MSHRRLWCTCVILISIGIYVFATPRYKRVVGGLPTKKDAYPWQVSIQRGKSGTSEKSDHLCGGALIQNEWVVTAAHCVLATVNYSDISVVVGAWNMSDTSISKIPVERVIIPDYNSTTNVNDIALLKLQKHNFSLTTVELPSYSYNAEGDCTVIGWGQTDEFDEENMPDILQYAILPVIEDMECERRLISYSVHHTMLCAGGGEIDACQGDSGSPLLCWNNGSDVLAGLVSWGVGCATPNMPGVYTEVAYFIPWIEDTINKNTF